MQRYDRMSNEKYIRRCENESTEVDKYSKFKSVRIVDGKQKSVIVNICGEIINNNPTKEDLKNVKPEISRRQLGKLTEQELKEYLLEYLRYFYYKEGRVPGTKDFSNPKYPSRELYRSVFKSWNNAIRDAGIHDVCCKCGATDTWNWYRDPESKKRLCGECYKKLPGGVYDKSRLRAMCRNKELDLDKHNMALGFLGESIVAKTLGLDTCAKKIDRFTYKYDIYQGPIDGRIEVKTAEISYLGDRWSFGKIKPEKFDIIYLVCMSKDLKDVERIYKIKSEKIDKDSIAIIKDPSRSAKWEKFKIDEIPYNNSYHSMNIENCKVLKNRVKKIEKKLG